MGVSGGGAKACGQGARLHSAPHARKSPAPLARQRHSCARRPRTDPQPAHTPAAWCPTRGPRPWRSQRAAQSPWGPARTPWRQRLRPRPQRHPCGTPAPARASAAHRTGAALPPPGSLPRRTGSLRRGRVGGWRVVGKRMGQEARAQHVRARRAGEKKNMHTPSPNPARVGWGAGGEWRVSRGGELPVLGGARAGRALVNNAR